MQVFSVLSLLANGPILAASGRQVTRNGPSRNFWLSPRNLLPNVPPRQESEANQQEGHYRISVTVYCCNMTRAVGDVALIPSRLEGRAVINRSFEVEPQYRAPVRGLPDFWIFKIILLFEETN
jgi:hypothetical protein